MQCATCPTIRSNLVYHIFYVMLPPHPGPAPNAPHFGKSLSGIVAAQRERRDHGFT